MRCFLLKAYESTERPLSKEKLYWLLFIYYVKLNLKFSSVMASFDRNKKEEFLKNIRSWNLLPLFHSPSNMYIKIMHLSRQIKSLWSRTYCFSVAESALNDLVIQHCSKQNTFRAVFFTSPSLFSMVIEDNVDIKCGGIYGLLLVALCYVFLTFLCWWHYALLWQF